MNIHDQITHIHYLISQLLFISNEAQQIFINESNEITDFFAVSTQFLCLSHFFFSAISLKTRIVKDVYDVKGRRRVCNREMTRFFKYKYGCVYIGTNSTGFNGMQSWWVKD